MIVEQTQEKYIPLVVIPKGVAYVEIKDFAVIARDMTVGLLGGLASGRDMQKHVFLDSG